MTGRWTPKIPNNKYATSSGTAVTRFDTHCSFSRAPPIPGRKVTRARESMPVAKYFCRVGVARENGPSPASDGTRETGQETGHQRQARDGARETEQREH